MKIKEMVYSALFAAIVAVLGLIPSIPLPFIPVPITLQTMGVMLAGSFLGKKLGGISMGLVVIIVLLGLPILSGGRGGLSVLVGPTGGYFIVWPLAGFLIGFLTEKNWCKITILKYAIINTIGGIILINIVGAVYLSFVADMSVGAALLSSIAFIPGDIIKAIIVSIICYKIRMLSPINQFISPENED